MNNLNEWEKRMDFEENTIYISDCLCLLKHWYNKLKLTKLLDLIYIDPPFNSKRDYNIIIQPHDIQSQEKAFEDTWTLVNYSECLDEIKKMGHHNVFWFIEGLKNSNLSSGHISYLANMAIRVIYMKEMLKDSGNFCYHCDPTMSHYIKIMLDFIFGINNFLNEIIWKRSPNTGSLKAVSNMFPKNHDIIFWYAKSNNYKFKKTIKPYPKDEIGWRFPYDDHDGKGPYHWNTLTKVSKEKFQNLKDNNEIKKSKREMVKHPYSYKVYLNRTQGGIAISTLWDDINSVHGSSKEYLGYPTQKPEPLLERILLTLSDENDLVADFFMGGGTTLAVAKKHNRNFIGSDINLRAVQWTSNRLNNIKTPPPHLISGIPDNSTDLKIYLKNFTPSVGGFTLEDLVIKIYLSHTVPAYNFEVIGQSKNNVGFDGEFIWNYKGKARRGIIQVTSSHGYQHFGSFCNTMSNIRADLGVYITFEKNITQNMKSQVGTSPPIGPYKSLQILSIEDLVDNKKLFDVPLDILKI